MKKSFKDEQQPVDKDEFADHNIYESSESECYLGPKSETKTNWKHILFCTFLTAKSSLMSEIKPNACPVLVFQPNYTLPVQFLIDLN